MNKNGPIIIIEDDDEDQLFIQEVFQKLKYQNELIFFSDGEKALEFLNQGTAVPFIILSDVKMPKLSGLELRQKLKTDADLTIKCIPYLFFSTAISQTEIIKAYSTSVQGFFLKQNSFEELEKTITVIMEYWTRCAPPTNVSK